MKSTLLFFSLFSFLATASEGDRVTLCESPESLRPIEAIKALKVKMSKIDNSSPESKNLTVLLYSKNRQQKATDIYSDIKSRALKLLLAHASVENKDLVASIEKRLASSQLILDPIFAYPNDHLGTMPDSNIQIGGWIELVDNYPEALSLLLAHEVGHVIGPTHSFLANLAAKKTKPEIIPYDKHYPLDEYMQETILKVRGHDFTCLQDRADELMRGHPAFRHNGEVLGQAIVDLQTKNANISLDEYPIARTHCMPFQREEAFADIVAREILKDEDLTLKKSINSFAFFCENAEVEKKLGHREPDPHPEMTYRIENLLTL
ncbi:MAG: hypothetical protein PHY93_12405 [Bacteriovorax sp.]|nr:hypothetical protein [Bacteriovorax sp.]